MSLAPGKRATAELHLQLPRVVGAAGPGDAGDALIVQGDVEQHPCPPREVHHELLHGEHPVRGAVPGVVGVHLVAAGGEQDLSADRAGQREHAAVPTAQAVPDRPGHRPRHAAPAIVIEVPRMTDRGTRNGERGTIFGIDFYNVGMKMFPFPSLERRSRNIDEGAFPFPGDYGACWKPT